jgi:uroporphyrinogen-III decarboxylase
MSQSAKELYDLRLKRFNDAVALRSPDRIPIASHSAYFFYKFAGYTFKDVMYDYEKAAESIKKAVKYFQWDMAPAVPAGSGPLMEMFGLTQYKWPGHSLPNEHLFQFVEGEYMRADEYDELLANPEGFVIRKVVPRISKLFEPISAFPSTILMTGGQSLIARMGALAGNPKIVHVLQTLIKAGEETKKYNDARARMVSDLKEEGFPMMSGPHCSSPFDWIGNYLRGMRGIVLDIYRNPDKLLAAVDLFTPLLIENAIQVAKTTGNPRVFLPLHRGAGGLMSNDQFAKFYWPSLRTIFFTLIDAGLTPMPFFEGDYTDRLEYLAELPKGKILGNFQNMELAKYKRILGDTMCFRGNVPASLLVTGSPQGVKEYVKMLIDTLGESGGLIIDGGSGMPYESRTENVEAMVQAVFEFGRNS